MVNFVHTDNSPWILGGDFNVVAAVSEYRGNSSPLLNDIGDFRECIDSCELVDMPMVESTYTWTAVRSNGRVWEKLDRYLGNQEFINQFGAVCT
ncbi:unnamed protein product [Cuscuta europaea]|uniref:Endonuclease/exonuclease/phosphatase domain-containing protein n=1 Tax=Cuscuta europaea TaxID=41803 RepID=A0A9P0YWF5_CUSEU|nr:unnamed protein product [Cuscuta europaea]